MDAGEFPDRKKSSSGLRTEELKDSRYPSVPEPTGGLGGPLVPRPTGILSSNTCPGNSNIPEYAYNIRC